MSVRNHEIYANFVTRICLLYLQVPCRSVIKNKLLRNSWFTLLTTYKTYKLYVRLRKNFVEEFLFSRQLFLGSYVLRWRNTCLLWVFLLSVIDTSDECFVPVLGTVNERIEIIILHAIVTRKRMTFGKLTLRKLFLIVLQEVCADFGQINIEISI